MKKKRTTGLRLTVAAAAALLLGTLSDDAGAADLRVDRESTEQEPDGQTWATAYKYIQDALVEALANEDEFDVIWVAGNETYYPDDTGSNGDRTLSFELHDKITIEGGYAGIGGSSDGQRNLETFPTTLSGDVDDSGDGDSYHVVFAQSVDATAMLDGFTITGGHAEGTGEQGNGAGIYIGGLDSGDDASPVITHCTITANWAEGLGGGGIFVRSNSANESAPEIRECRIDNNVSEGGGGGIQSVRSAPRIVSCAPTSAGANWGIWNNVADDHGGGIEILNASEASIVNCAIDGNEAGSGGGIALTGSDPDDTKPQIVNCRITNNMCEIEGGGIFSLKSKTTVLNTTIADNGSDGDGGGYYEATHPGAGSSIVNSILWDNMADGASQQVSVERFGVGSEKFLRIAYSDVEGGVTEVEDPDQMVDYQSSNVNVAPGLEDDTYRPCSGSAIRDIGTNLELVEDEFDVDGDNDYTEETPDLAGLFRVVAGTADPTECLVDMGAYEYACPDFGDDGCVDFDDILAISHNWDAVDCIHDLDQSGTVGFNDLVRVLSAWGPCPCTDEEACGTVSEDLDCMGLTAQDWSEFVSNADDEDYRCWMEHYWYVHCQCMGTCFDTAPTGCGADPFGGHP